jgi:membrane protein CcdC involved in cytochrome C biogenesis
MTRREVRWGWNVRKILRIVLTILMYTGVFIFLVPYFRGTITTSVLFLIFGAGLAVVCGLLRCYLTEGDCGRITQHGRDW